MSVSKLIILNYYGALPRYTHYFVEACKRNTGYSFIIFNDGRESVVDKNVSFIKSTLADFNKRATETLGIDIRLDRPFKVCDLRPAYGVIYGDLIKDFDFWGFCDLDTIPGNFDAFLTDDLLSRIDVYSSKPKWNSGSFSLFRNRVDVNNLFRATDDWKHIFSSSKYYGFDECNQRWDGKPIRTSERTRELLSIYDLVHSIDGIRPFYDDSVIEWPEDIRNLKWSHGHWIDLQTGKEFMYFHLLLMKNSWRFFQPVLDFSKPVFVSGLGLSNINQAEFTIGSLLWRFRRMLYCIPGIIHSFKKQGILKIASKVWRRSILYK